MTSQTIYTIFIYIEVFMYEPNEDGPFWQLQEAKAMFSKVVRSAQDKPQIITVHGRENAVVLSMDAYKKLISPKNSLVNFLEQSPWADLDQELPQRAYDNMRETGL